MVLQLEARVAEQRVQLADAGRHHQLFVERARYELPPCIACRSSVMRVLMLMLMLSAAHASAMEQAAARHEVQLQAKDASACEVRASVSLPLQCMQCVG